MQRRALVRFVTSYLIVLIIPLAAFLVYFRVNVMSLVHERMDAELMGAARNTALALESEMDQILAAAEIIQETNAFTLLRLGNPRNAIDTQAYLRGFASVSELITSVAYYPFGSDRVYTSVSPLYPEVYTENMYPHHSRLEAVSWISGLSRGFAPADGVDSTMLYAVPIPTYGPSHRGVLVFEVNRSTLDRILSAAVPRSGGGRVALVFGDSRVAEVGEMRSSAEPFASVPVAGYRLSLMVHLDESARSGEINRRIAVMAILTAGLLALCLPLVYVFSMASVNPLTHLTQFLHATLRLSETNENPALEAEHAITSLLNEIDQSSDLVRRELLLQAIRGSVEDWPAFSRRCRTYGIDVSGRAYTVVIVTSECAAEEDRTGTLTAHLSEFLGGDYTVAGLREFSEGDHVLIVGSERSAATEEDDGVAGARLTEWAGSLATVERCRWSVAVGRTVSSPRGIPQSYLQAKSAQEHRFVLGFNRVLRADQLLDAAESEIAYPSTQLEHLANTVSAGDVRGVHRAIHGIFSVLRASSPSLFFARCVSYDAVTTLINGAGPDTAYWRFADAISLAEVRTLEQMEDLLIQVGSDLCGLVSANLDRGRSFDRVVATIDRRICEPTLSAHSVAMEFGMSLSNLSHQFRRYAGVTFQAYLSQKRIAEAKRLLTETDDTLADVVRSIGYGDASSFIKKFRAGTGLTPIEYRRRVRQGPSG